MRHPLPVSGIHLLGVPKLKIHSFLDLDLNSQSGQQLALSLFHSLVEVAAWCKLNKYTLILNGGEYQEVPQLHLHLIDGNFELPTTDPAGYTDGDPQEFAARPFHHSLIPILSPAPIVDLSNPTHADVLLDLMIRAQHIIRQRQLPAYRLVYRSNEPMQIHLIGAARD